MADLIWDDVAYMFDPSDGGTLPDVVVDGTTAADWQALLDLVRERGWAHEYEDGDTVLPLPAAGTVLARPDDAECPSLVVRPTAEVCAIFRFYSAEAIDFDVSLREIQGQERLDVLCAFLTAIGRRLGKPVVMYAEGGYDNCPMIGYDPEADRVVSMRAERVDG
ncbi:hypothetical protein ACIQWA_02915 [Kitasatospora sp. NPDC098652]|uniref:hypothetical protein n=1 Tax=Kitasatospora sp. NPDC098652 TaxID=3364095 RepID=UPI0038148358